MKGYSKFPKKQMYVLLVSCAVIIFAASIETMIKVKDVNLYNQWLTQIQAEQSLPYTDGELFDAYLAGNLSYYFLTIIIPMAYGIHTYFAYTKLRLSGMFIGLWMVLCLGGLAYTLIEMNLSSIFYYAKILSYITLLVTTLSLTNVLNEDKLL